MLHIVCNFMNTYKQMKQWARRSAGAKAWPLGPMTALVALSAIAMFLAVVSFGEYASRPPGISAYSAIEMSGLYQSGEPMRPSKPMMAYHEDPYEYVAREMDWSIVAARYSGRFTSREPGEHALVMTSRTDVIEVRLNDVALLPDVRRPRLNGSFVAEPVIYTLPESLMRRGENRYSIVIKRNLRGPFVFPDFAVGPARLIIAPSQFRHLMTVEIALIGIVVMSFTALLALSVSWPQGERRRNVYFVLMLALSAAVSTMFMFSSAQKYEVTWLVASSILVAAQAISVILYVVHDINHSRIVNPKSIAAVVIILAMVAMSAAITQYRGINPNYHLFILMISCRLFSVGIGALAALLLAFEIARSGGLRIAERFILIMWFIATSLDQGHPGLFAVFTPFVPGLPLSLQWTPILGSLTGLAKVASLARQAGEARRTVLSANTKLQEALSLREAQLTASQQEREQILSRQVMLDERQRIVRDMHDGIGGQLVGLMMQVRGGEYEPKHLEQSLQSSIADLRLIVDSMDTAEEGLAEAFRAFEHRVRPQIEAAGMEFSFAHHLPESTPSLAPRQTLQVLRILQEAVTNCLRHSGGNKVQVSSGLDPLGQLRAVVEDNGKGLPETMSGGRGLTSMKSRATALSGTLDLTSSRAGTKIILTVPLTELPTHLAQL